jgi:hypothetical protein
MDTQVGFGGSSLDCALLVGFYRWLIKLQFLSSSSTCMYILAWHYVAGTFFLDFRSNEWMMDTSVRRENSSSCLGGSGIDGWVCDTLMNGVSFED